MPTVNDPNTDIIFDATLMYLEVKIYVAQRKLPPVSSCFFQCWCKYY